MVCIAFVLDVEQRQKYYYILGGFMVIKQVKMLSSILRPVSRAAHIGEEVNGAAVPGGQPAPSM